MKCNSMAGFFSKKQYAAMAESAFAMKLLKDRCLECSICAILINEFFILFFTFVINIRWLRQTRRGVESTKLMPVQVPPGLCRGIQCCLFRQCRGSLEAVGHPVTGFDYFGCDDARYGWNVVCQKDKVG